MISVGGNKTAQAQRKTVTANTIGEGIETWSAHGTAMTGWLDLSGGRADYQSYNAKIQESTHVFITSAITSGLKETDRLVIDSKTYEITMIDDPMGLGYHYEIFLKFVGQ